MKKLTPSLAAARLHRVELKLCKKVYHTMQFVRQRGSLGAIQKMKKFID